MARPRRTDDEALPLGAILRRRPPWPAAPHEHRPPEPTPTPTPTASPTPPVDDPWSTFLVGPENALAVAAAQALARGEPPEGLSPLVLFGPSGVGKSRLLAALLADWRRRHPSLASLATDAEGFAAACALAGRHPRAWAERRDAMRSCSLFVLDDLLSLDRSPLALRELVFTLDDLLAAGAVVAVAALRPPAQWIDAGLPPRLVSRLAAGLTLEIAPPGDDLRRRYTLDHARKTPGPPLDADAIVAATASWREIDGALARLALHRRTRTQTPAPASAPDLALSPEPRADHPAWTIDSVMRAVAAQFRVTLHELRSPTRRAVVVQPRHLAMYLAREWTGASFARIGRAFGNRDPATVRHACRAAAQRVAARPDQAAAVAAIRARAADVKRSSLD